MQPGEQEAEVELAEFGINPVQPALQFEGTEATNCGFVTYKQCMDTVSGVGGWCEPNQFYDGRPFRDK